MNDSNARDLDRLSELLADEATADLDAGNSAEFRQLLDRHPGVGRNELMEVAALVQVAFLRQRKGGPVDRMPPGLRERLASQGEVVAIRQRGPSPARSPFGVLGWALAAALAIALVLIRNEAPVTAPALDATLARAQLITEAPDVITVPWAPPSAGGYERVTGDVVWSASRQRGYLRLANMPVNDPARTQYQLWIVDPSRDTHPVDGGVFNVGATGEVVIPIQAKLLIRSPAAFAITAEQPGGVVVSAGPLLVVAAT